MWAWGFPNFLRPGPRAPLPNAGDASLRFRCSRTNVRSAPVLARLRLRPRSAAGLARGSGYERVTDDAFRPDGQSGRWDSNPRRSAWKADALPTELLPQNGGAARRPHRWRALDSNQRRRMPAGLQPAPFGPSRSEE